MRGLLGATVLACLATLCSSSAAVASVTSELAFHRGVAAYGAERFDEARGHFEKVLEESPQDVAALSYLALIEQRQGRPQRAIAYHEQAVHADPTRVDSRVDLAAALLEVGQNAGARQILDDVLASHPDHARANLYAGIARYREGEPAAALPSLERAASDPELELHARYYTGLVETFLGDAAGAAAAFSAVEEQSPSHPLGRSARVLRGGGAGVERPWTLALISGVEWDDNVTVVGDDPTSGASEQTDLRGLLRLSGDYALYREGGLDLRIGYDGYASLHEDVDEVDLQTHVGTLSGGWRLDPVLLGLRYDFAYSFLGHARDFGRLHRITPSATFLEGRLGATQLFYQHDELAYFRTPAADALDRDGRELGLGLNQYFFLSGGRSYLRAGVRREALHSSGDEFRFRGYELSGGVGLLLPRRMELAALYGRAYHDYSHRSIFELKPTERRDRIDRLNLDLTVPVGDRLRATLSTAFTFNGSNVDVFDYDRKIVGATLGYDF